MSSAWSSQGVVLATTVAVSSTMVLLLLCGDKATFLENTDKSQESGGGVVATSQPMLRSCLSSGKKDGRKVKKVRFASDVKDSGAKNDKYTKAAREGMMQQHISYGTHTKTLNDGLVNENFTMLVEFSN